LTINLQAEVDLTSTLGASLPWSDFTLYPRIYDASLFRWTNWR